MVGCAPGADSATPLRFETVTLHVDRTALDNRLFEHARDLGTSFVWERVTSIDSAGEQVNGCATASGERVNARWYLDASGTSRVFARALGIPATFYGRAKVCLWTYFDTPPLHDGTSFFVDNRTDYLPWVWDIPISPTQTSVGLVLPADTVRDQRRAGATVESILRERIDASRPIRPAIGRVRSVQRRSHVVSTLRDGEGLRRQLADGGRGGIDARPTDR